MREHLFATTDYREDPAQSSSTAPADRADVKVGKYLDAIVDDLHLPFTRSRPDTDIYVKLKVPPGTKPIVVRPYAITNPLRRQFAKEELERMIERGEIQKSNSPWCLAAFIQPKKSGKGVRLLLDARPLNKLLQQDAFTVPKISTLVGDVAAAQPTVFSTLDLKSGFYNLKVDPESRKMLAFDLGCGQGLYEFLVLGQGLNPGVSAMQRVMTSLLDGCESVLGPDGYRRGGAKAYLDDIIIYSRTVEDHNLLVREVLKRLANAGFQLALNKAHLFMKSVDWLGYRLEEGTLRPLQKNVEKIKSLVGPRKPPRTVSDCRRILGVLNYYRQFCPHFSTIAEPITKLTKTANKTDNLIEWGEEQDKAFYALYDRLASDDCFLVLPDYAAAQHDDPEKRRPFVLF